MTLVSSRRRSPAIAAVVLAVATLLLVVGWLQARPNAPRVTGSARLVPAASSDGLAGSRPSASQLAAAHRVPTANPFAHLGRSRHNEVRLATIGADFWPAQGAKPIISKQTAIAKSAAGYSPLTTSSAPDAVLVEYTNVFGLEAPDGTMTPSVPTQLAWLVKTSGMSAAGPVPYRPGATTGPPPQMFQCDFYVVTSAVDGSRIDAFRIC
jgi:hypothetical protein